MRVEVGEALRVRVTIEGASYVTLGRAHPHLRGEESNSGRALQDEVAEAILGLPVQVPISLGTLSSHLASLTSLQHWSVYSSRNASLSL